jgi:hypothetical protein
VGSDEPDETSHTAPAEPAGTPQLRAFAADLRAATATFVEATAAAAARSFDDLPRLRTSWESSSPLVLHSILLRRGFFTGKGGSHYDCNADIAHSLFLAIGQAWVQYFRTDVPAITQPMLRDFTELTGARPMALARETQRFAREVEPDLLAAIVEVVRERLVPHYDRLSQSPDLLSRGEMVDGLAAAIELERPALRADVVECVRTWLAGVVDDLVAAAYADASPISRRA